MKKSKKVLKNKQKPSKLRRVIVALLALGAVGTVAIGIKAYFDGPKYSVGDCLCDSVDEICVKITGIDEENYHIDVVVLGYDATGTGKIDVIDNRETLRKVDCKTGEPTSAKTNQ